MARTTFHSALRRAILANLAAGEEMKLSHPVRVSNNSMMGYGDIVGVYRHGKQGAARCFDGFNNAYYLSELTEEQCQEILNAMNV